MKNFLLAIPFIRNKITRNTIQQQQNELELLNIVNRSVSYMIAPNIVGLVNEGKFDITVLSSTFYLKNFIVKLLGNKSKNIVSRIWCERAVIKSNPEVSAYLFHLPSSGEVGQNDVVSFVINSSGKADFYCWEWSFGQTRMICTWEDKKHLNFGLCDDKIEFVKRIVSLAEENA